MKSILLAVICLIAWTTHANETELSPADFLAKHQALEKLSEDQIISGSKVLESAVAKGADIPEAQLKPIFDLMFLLLRDDVTGYTVEAFDPLYRKKKSYFDSLLKKRSAADQNLFRKRLEIFERESAEGNG